MTPERFQQIDRTFEQIVDLPLDEQNPALKRLCGDDTELLQEVTKLLSGHPRSAGFVGNIVSNAAGETLLASGQAKDFGEWSIERKLGQGGMGTVYFARRDRTDEGFVQTAAIKVLRPGLEGPDLFQRFRDERRILAALRHPNIAQMLDGGSTRAGLPWFAMEYVEGDPLHRYCESSQMDEVGKLRLFRSICMGVHYAHSNLVIHCDLKPSNILVQRDGTPKLLDFGIAKVLQGPATGEGQPGDDAVTQFRMLTPDFASPEQISGAPVSTATDVYSLGVILYHLLTRRHPFRSPTTTVEELLRAVREQDPASPGINADLDNIILKAMRKDPERRYASAEALAADLDRYLAGFPVLARPESWSYAAAKFMGRNRIAVSIAGVAVLLLAGFAAVNVRERKIAENERRTAEAALDFLSHIYRAPNPNESLGKAPTAAQLLDAGAKRIDAELSGSPPAQARLLEVMASAYVGLAEYERATDMLRKAQAIRERLAGGKADLALAETMAQLGSTLYENGDYKESAEWQAKALAMRETLQGPNGALVGDSLYEAAIVDDAVGDFPSASAKCERALLILRETRGEKSLDVANALTLLGDIRRHGGDARGSEPVYRETLAIRKALLGPEHPDVAHSLNHLGRALIQMGKPADATPYIEEALRIRRKIFGDTHPETVSSQSNLAGAYTTLGKVEAAIELFKASLDALRSRYQENHPYVGQAYHSVASAYAKKGDPASAQPYAEKALAILTKLNGPKQPERIGSLHLNGVIARRLGRRDSALAMLKEAVLLRTAVRGPEHPETAESQWQLGDCLMSDASEAGRAEQLLVAAWNSYAKSRGEEHPVCKRMAKSLADFYRERSPGKAAEWQAKSE